jgi:hypothetical protein
VLNGTQGNDEIIERVAALDIGKAELVCYIRVPDAGHPGRRLQEVGSYPTMTRSLAPRFLYHAEQGSEQGLVRPVQLRPPRLPALQHDELVAQDQDLRGLPHLLTPRQQQLRGDPRNQEEHESQAHDR